MSAVRRLTLAGAERLRIASPARADRRGDEGRRDSPGSLAGPAVAPSLPEAIGRPWLAIVGDDNETSRGPDAYDRDGLRGLAARAEGLAVYSGAAAVEFYGLFAATAALGVNVLVVETQLAHHAEWSTFLRAATPNAAFLDILPPGGSA